VPALVRAVVVRRRVLLRRRRVVPPGGAAAVGVLSAVKIDCFAQSTGIKRGFELLLLGVWPSTA
jgi:hypothetical protein